MGLELYDTKDLMEKKPIWNHVQLDPMPENRNPQRQGWDEWMRAGDALQV